MTKMQKVSSSAIAEIGHDPESEELHVRFKTDGPVYVYPGVTADDHAALVNAGSIGRHFLQTIKPRVPAGSVRKIG